LQIEIVQLTPYFPQALYAEMGVTH
jgi:hypothetical protein